MLCFLELALTPPYACYISWFIVVVLQGTSDDKKYLVWLVSSSTLILSQDWSYQTFPKWHKFVYVALLHLGMVKVMSDLTRRNLQEHWFSAWGNTRQHVPWTRYSGPAFALSECSGKTGPSRMGRKQSNEYFGTQFRKMREQGIGGVHAFPNSLSVT